MNKALSNSQRARYARDCLACTEAQTKTIPDETYYFCSYHQRYHCRDHAGRCQKLHGYALVDRISGYAKDKTKPTNWAETLRCKEQNEYCKFNTWEDQIILDMFICAEFSVIQTRQTIV